MTVIAAYPSQYNTWLPSLEDSNRLLVDFSRNPRDFALNKYMQIVPVQKTQGYYLVMTLEERMRLLDTNLSNFHWPDGADAPLGNNGTESFQFQLFKAYRYAYPFTLGDMAIDQAAWDISSQHLDIKAQQAMTARTQLCYSALTAASWGSNTASLSAAKWSAATTANLNIKTSLDTAITQILKATGGVVRRSQLQLVINPNVAKAMAESQEIVDYLKGSPFALPFIKADTSGGDGDDSALLYGLPPTYAGLKIVVDDTVKVTTKKGATTSQSFVFADTVAFITARRGSLEGLYGGPSFSTVTMFCYDKDDMSVEVKHDVENRRVFGRVVDTFVPIVTAPVSGYYFTSVT